MIDEEKRYQEAKRLISKGNFKDALDILRDAALADYKDSKFYLACTNMRVGDVDEGEASLIELIEVQKNSNAAFVLANELRSKCEYERSTKYYLLASQLGYWAASYHIGMLLSLGKIPENFIEVNDMQPAMYYFSKAASKGHVFAKKKIIQRKLLDGNISSFWYRINIFLLMIRTVWIIAISKGKDLRIVR